MNRCVSSLNSVYKPLTEQKCYVKVMACKFVHNPAFCGNNIQKKGKKDEHAVNASNARGP